MNEVVTQENKQLATTNEQNMIDMISKLAADPNVNVDKIERLLDVQMKMMDRQAKINFDNALADMQSEMPRIAKTGEIKTKDGKVAAKYMKYEDIDMATRESRNKHGFSILHDRRDEGGKMIVTTTLKHRDGHQESVSMPLPYDQPNQLKNAVQSAVSTFSYGKRVNVCSLLDIVAEGEDDDGVGSGHIKIDDQQAEEIKETLRETGADVKRFLEYMGVSCVEKIAMKDYGKAYMALKRKIRTLPAPEASA